MSIPEGKQGFGNHSLFRRVFVEQSRVLWLLLSIAKRKNSPQIHQQQLSEAAKRFLREYGLQNRHTTFFQAQRLLKLANQIFFRSFLLPELLFLSAFFFLR